MLWPTTASTDDALPVLSGQARPWDTHTQDLDIIAAVRLSRAMAARSRVVSTQGGTQWMAEAHSSAEHMSLRR